MRCDVKLCYTCTCQMLLSEEEVRIKSRLWFAENADFLKELEGQYRERERGGGSVVSTESERGSVVVCLRESLNHREKRKTSNVGGREEHQI